MTLDRDRGSLEKLESQPWPLAVPARVRTSRVIPRTIASLTVILWLVSFLWGTTALAKREREGQSILETIIPVGATQWGATTANKPGQCLGLVETELNAKREPTLRLQSTLKVSAGTSPLVTKLLADASFSDERRLTRIQGNATAGVWKLSFKMNEKTAGKLEVAALNTRSSSGEPQRFSVPWPEPVFLVERGKGRYSLRLPEDVRRTLASGGKKGDVTGLSKLRFSGLTANEVELCRNSIAESNAGLELPVLQLGSYFSMLSPDQQQALFSNLLGIDPGILTGGD